MDRAEAGGFGVALAGHALLLGVLSMGFANAVKPPIINQPMEVSLVEEAALEAAAPVPSEAEPAPKLAEVEGPVEPVAAPPEPQSEPIPEPIPEPVPQPKAIEPVPAPKPKPVPKPLPAKPAKPKAVAKPAPPKPAPAKPAPPKPKAAAVQKTQAKPAAVARPTPAKAAVAKPTGRLGGLLDGISDKETQSRSTTPPARVASAAVQSSLGAEVRRQLKPHWKSPTGADADKLRTKLSITLAPNGTVTKVQVLETTGQTDSNRPQVKLHQEQAVKAARLASPFRLPAEYYDAWKIIQPSFDKRLSQ